MKRIVSVRMYRLFLCENLGIRGERICFQMNF